MKICFVGLGSIGVRHLRNLTKVLIDKGVAFSVDALRSSERLLATDIESLISRQYFDINELPYDYDVAFICTPTSKHYGDIEKMSAHTKHMFIEKPIFDRIYDIEKLNLNVNGQYYVACPLRYNAVLQYIKNYVKEHKVFSARAICSTYLPDWRPGVDYRTVYSAHKNMGGGVSIDLIHEWDYLCWLFGVPKLVKGVCGKYSDLEIDSDDLALYF